MSEVIHCQSPYVVTPNPGTRLEQLQAAYADAKAAADEAGSRLKLITDGIKAELVAQAPEGHTRIGLRGEHGPALQLTYSESWRIDATKLKAEDPVTYVRYAKKSGSWSLRAIGPSAGGDES